MRALAGQGGGAPARAILEAAPEPVLVISRDGRIAYANSACERLLGRARAALLDRPAAEFVSPGEGSVEIDPEGILRGTVELRLPDGAVRRASFSARGVPAANGVPAGAIAFVRDETEQHRARLHLSRQKEELEQTIRAVSHDLRSPLVSVLGFSRLLREEFAAALDSKGLHFLERIEQAGRTMEQLIRELLDFARIGHAGERRAWVDPREVLLQLRGELKPRLDQQGVDLDIPDEPPLVWCDRTRLYQILSNLVGNALDHMGPCERPRISVEVEADARCRRLRVADNGRGIPRELHERIFDLFHSGLRADGRRGTGVGLSIVKKIVEFHGGRVEVESAPGAGTAFHVTLPNPS